jgi:tetratricopeptide (TPR) repeat protein
MADQTLSPEQYARSGMTHFKAGDFQAAQQYFAAAAAGYTTLGDTLSSAEMQNNLSLVYLKLSKPQQALDAVAGTDVAFAAAGDTHRQALALGNQASALEALGKLEPALEKYEACADLLKKVGDSDNRVVVMQAMSQLQLRMGRQLEAITSMQIALDNKSKLSVKESLLRRLLKFPSKFLNR